MSGNVNVNNPIKVYPEGSMWCALWGEDIQSGHSSFGRSPAAALMELLNQEAVWEETPHGVWNLTCPNCGVQAVHVMPYPYARNSVPCHCCHKPIPVTSDPFSFASKADNDVWDIGNDSGN